jgi:hypothetical protein
VIDVKMTGAEKVDATLVAIEKASKAIAISAVAAGLSVLARAAKSASPGSIKNETGKYLKVAGDKVLGRAGLIRFPRPGDGQNGPHGVYVDQGTKYITPRRFIASALTAAKPAAVAAMELAAKRRLDRIVSGDK